MKELGRVKAKDLQRVTLNENVRRNANEVYDFTDVEYLCNHPVVVKIPYNNKIEEFNCWVDEISVDGKGVVTARFRPKVEYPQI